jgi:site-specific DNA-methyltransferase (adenine-specific)
LALLFKKGNIMESEVYNIDCIEYMKDIEDNYFELAIVDPPYGINADKKNSDDSFKTVKSACKSKKYGNQNWDNNIPELLYFKELKRISKNQIIWGINYYPFNFIGGRIYWKKNVSMPTYSDGELAYCSLINSIKEFEFTWHGMVQGDMKNKEARIHPTQKPVALYKWLLTNYAKPNDKIFDSHLGSGSSRVAAYELGFDFVGCELDKDYFGDQEKRFMEFKKKYHNEFYIPEENNLLFKGVL